MHMAAADDPRTRRKARIAIGLRAVRERAGLTQQELGDQTGVARTRLNAYENAVYEPGPDKLQAFADALGVEPWQFEALGAEGDA
jgi:transcriptional regulator with XRE-family HTH domain